jgi:acetoin utilization protein AcuB
MCVSAIMSPRPVTVSSDDTASTALRYLKDHGVRRLPVLDEGGRVVGVVTENDLKRVPASEVSSLELDATAFLADRVRVCDVMTRQPITISPATPIKVAASILTNHRVGCLPVVEGRRLVGIVTQQDFFKVLAPTVRDRPMVSV